MRHSINKKGPAEKFTEIEIENDIYWYILSDIERCCLFLIEQSWRVSHSGLIFLVDTIAILSTASWKPLWRSGKRTGLLQRSYPGVSGSNPDRGVWFLVRKLFSKLPAKIYCRILINSRDTKTSWMKPLHFYFKYRCHNVRLGH